jgi:soluble lytic murein transglycosylase
MKKTVIITLLMIFIAVPSFADIYKYTDENGVVCYTDTPYGKKAKLVMKAKKPAQKKLTTSKNYNSLIRKAASKYQVEPDLIKAVIKTESNGNYRAVSKKGAMGLMQLMPTTANDMSVSNPYNPEQNIEGGTKYLRLLLDKFNGDLTLALAAYNAGPKVVEKYGNVPPYSETKNYVKKVFSLYKGKRRYALGEPLKKQTPVYKVTLEDGTVLFTNSPLLKPGSVRF